MPRGDRTGPGGMGPMTGRAAGYCNGYDRPGYANFGYPGRGMGRGGGRGFGFRNQNMAPGPYFGGAWRTGPYTPPPVNFTPEQDLEMRKKEVELMEAELKAAKEQIINLEKNLD